jgi:Zn-dependent protease
VLSGRQPHSDAVDLSLFRDCVINWWPFPALTLVCLAMAHKARRRARADQHVMRTYAVAVTWALGALVLGLIATPQVVLLQRDYRTAHSVSLVAPPTLESTPSKWKPAIDEFIEATSPAVRKSSVTGILQSRLTGARYLLLTRLERNRLGLADLQTGMEVRTQRQGDRSLTGPGSAVTGCGPATTHLLVESPRTSPLQLCQWRHGGSTGYLYLLSAEPMSYESMLGDTEAIKSAVLVASMSRYHPFQSSGMLFVELAIAALVVVLSIVGHELSHAVIARLVGSEVLGVTIGVGKCVWQRRMFGVDVRCCSLPLGGHVRHRRTSARPTRWRPAAIAAAGPLFNLLVAWVLLIALEDSTLALISASLGLVNLIPYSVLLPDVNVRIGTDGYQLVRALRPQRVNPPNSLSNSLSA